MDNKPLISIIVPVYNVEHYLKQCINSIINQTYDHLEIILVDDGSLDACPQICDYYAKKDKRIKVLHKRNGGLADARNAGLKIASGEYIGFVDSDDYIDPMMYEKMIRGCLSYKTQIATCGRTNIDDKGHLISKRFTIPTTMVFDSKKVIKGLITWNKFDVASWDKLYRKDLFSNIEFPLGVYSEDLTVIPILIRKCNKIVHVGDSLYFYRQRNGSITKENFSKNKLTMLTQAEKLYNMIVHWYPDMQKEAFYFLWRYYTAFVNSAYSSNCRGMKHIIDEGFRFIRKYRPYYCNSNITLRDITITKIKKSIVQIKLNIEALLQR